MTAIRLALGASRAHIVALIVIDPIKAVTSGLAVGAVVSWWVVAFLDSQLYGVSSRDPGLWAAAAVLIVSVASIAAAIPALRASGLDPVAAIRAE